MSPTRKKNIIDATIAGVATAAFLYIVNLCHGVYSEHFVKTKEETSIQEVETVQLQALSEFLDGTWIGIEDGEQVVLTFQTKDGLMTKNGYDFNIEFDFGADASTYYLKFLPSKQEIWTIIKRTDKLIVIKIGNDEPGTLYQKQ